MITGRNVHRHRIILGSSGELTEEDHVEQMANDGSGHFLPSQATEAYYHKDTKVFT